MLTKAFTKFEIASIPANLRQVIHQFKIETGLSRTDIEVLTVLYTLCGQGTVFRAPKDIATKLPTMSRDYLYDAISKLKTHGYIEQLRESFHNNSGHYRSGLYGCTWKGEKLVIDFVSLMELLGEKTAKGY